MRRHTLAWYKLFICFVFFIETTHAQNTFTTELEQQFKQYTSNTLTEKIYLGTDRNFYIAGELMWFKAYVRDAIQNTAQDISKVAYVDIIDRFNKPVLQTKMEIKKGDGNGSLYLPANLPSGTYKIRAYTSWMKNFDASFFFEKPFTVVNAQSAAGLPAPDSAVVYDLQFFPEGGNLIKNTESRIAFRMTDKNGKGVNSFSGYIINEQNDTVTAFSPGKFGIGSLLFTPSGTHIYKAYIKPATGNAFMKDLPAVLNEGYAMKLCKTAQGNISITVHATNTGSPGTVYLFAHTRGVIKSVQTSTFKGDSSLFNIDENILGEGITQFTVFNSLRQPVCERLYFKRPADRLIVKGSAGEPSYLTRKKITVDISSSDINNKSVAAGMSLAVYRMDSLQEDAQSDIYSYLWLSADLKGKVESPSWYFTAANDSTDKALDNLMLTHGWRRFRWDDVQQNRTASFEFLPEYTGHIITGRITDTLTHKSLPDAVVYLSVPGDRTQFYAAKSDDKGNLKFYTRNVYGPGEVITQTEEFPRSAVNIEINSPFSDKFSARPFPATYLSPALKNALEQSSINAQVQRKYAAGQLKLYRLPDTDSMPFYGKADEQYNLDDYTRFTTMEEVLREFVLGVLVGRSNRKFHLTVIDIPNNRLFKDNPLVLLDGVPVADIDHIMSYDPLKVRKVEVVKRRYYYGPLLLDGIVNFITYKGNLEEFQMDPKAVIIDYEGMQLQREFYSPVYETDRDVNNHIADFRNLLYWSPEVITGNNGKAQAQFYSSDVKGKYTGVLEGITADGKAGSSSFNFIVQ